LVFSSLSDGYMSIKSLHQHLRERGLEALQLEQRHKRLDADTQSELSALTPKLPAWMRPIAQHPREKAKP
jgi:hypothetical protein